VKKSFNFSRKEVQNKLRAGQKINAKDEFLESLMIGYLLQNYGTP
jgi:hypothetical protein